MEVKWSRRENELALVIELESTSIYKCEFYTRSNVVAFLGYFCVPLS